MGLCRFAGLGRVLSRAVDRWRPNVFALMVPLLLSACQDAAYLQKGIGAQLPAADIAQSTGLQDQYFRHLCAQVGYATCDLPTVDRQLWTLVVRQGMNDIDRRCDAYLEWLDNKKRSKGPLIAQSNAISATAQAIIQIVSPGSAAISIVGIAFGLLNQSIENYQSRLLLEIESSTINAVVLRARHDFRENTAGFSYNTRPDAEYALRTYLRICLPFAIETNINDYTTLGSRGIKVDGDNTINQGLVGLEGGRAEPLTPEAPVGTRPARGKFEQDNRLDEIFTGGVFVEADLVKMQRVFCLQGLGVGAIGSKTKAGIRIFEEARWPPGNSNLDGKINPAELNRIEALPDCDSTKFANYYERTELVDADQVKGLIQLMNARLPEGPIGEDLPLTSELVRAKISDARAAYGLDNFGGTAANQATRALGESLRRGPPEP